NFQKVYTEPYAGQFAAIAGTTLSNVWAVATTGHVYHSGATSSWSEATAPGGALDALVWAGASDVWTFGAGVAHHGPPPWTDYPIGDSTWTSVSGEAANDIWAVQQEITGVALRRWL